jgi:pyoverdine/dityrosine biosynthesis protein Dit1
MSHAGNAASPEDNKASRILSVIWAYRHRSAIVPDRFPEFAPKLESQLTDTVSRGEKVRFILPGFPFKAPAEGGKRRTLGSLPDKAEELALQTLDGFADSIAAIYEGGATVVIVSDASVYGGMCITEFLGRLTGFVTAC